MALGNAKGCSSPEHKHGLFTNDTNDAKEGYWGSPEHAQRGGNLQRQRRYLRLGLEGTLAETRGGEKRRQHLSQSDATYPEAPNQPAYRSHSPLHGKQLQAAIGSCGRPEQHVPAATATSLADADIAALAAGSRGGAAGSRSGPGPRGQWSVA